MKPLRSLLWIAACCTACWLLADAAHAQPYENTWVGLGTPSDNWDVPDNWQFDVNGETGPGVPDEAYFEHAIIDGGVTVNVTNEPADGENPPIQPGSVFVNGGSTLNIQSGGILTVVNNETTFGDFQVNDGVAQVYAGGQVTAENVNTQNAGSLILGGDASVTSTSTAFLNGVTRITGPDVALNAGGLTLGSTSVWEAVITGSTHSIVSSSGSVALNGTLRPDITSGTPSVGDEWVLWDAGNIVGDFTNVDASLVSLPATQGFTIRKESTGSVNGVLGILSVEQLLTAEVDRATGAVTLRNQGAVGVSIDHYTISSASQSIDASRFTSSLQDDGFDGGAWQEANPSAAGVSELNAQGFSQMAGDLENHLGDIFDPLASVTEFGQPVPEDLQFTYRQENGSVVTGVVAYVDESVVNNVLLTVDPASGDAQFKNDSTFSIEIDTYTVRSSSGSLLTSWDSLFDQSEGDWAEANPTTEALSELNPQASQALSPGESFTLAGLFNVATGDQDLSVEFRIPGVGLLQGVVRYDSFGVERFGDFNDDGVVDAADYTVWRDNLGLSDDALNDNGSGDASGLVVQADYDLWRANYGQVYDAPEVSSTAAPEPASMILVTLSGFATAAGRRRFERKHLSD